VLSIHLCCLQPPRLDIADCTGLPVTLVFLPAHDIATYVGEGNVDMGITGYDVVQESGEGENVETVSAYQHHMRMMQCSLLCRQLTTV
jgi:ATP phosphoribosyltransferase